MRKLILALCLLAGVAAVAEANPPRGSIGVYGAPGYYSYPGPPAYYPGYRGGYYDRKAEYYNRRGPYGPYYGPPQYRYNWYFQYGF